MEAQDAIRYLPTKARTRWVFGSHFEWRWCCGPTPNRFCEKFNLSIVNDRSKKQVCVSFIFQYLNIAMSCCNLAIKLQHFRKTRKERRAVFNRTNRNFDSWLQIFSCLSLLSNISLDALIVPWMRRFTSHNLHVIHSHLHSGISLDGFVFAAYLHSGCSRRLSQRITYVITKLYVIGLQVHQWF